MCIPKIHLTWLALTIRIPPHPFLLRNAAVEAGHVAQQPVNKAPKAANFHGSPKPNRLDNRLQLRRASSGPLAASSTRRRARGSSANAPSTPTSGLRRRRRRRQTAQNRRAQLGLELLKDLLYALGKAHPDWRSRLPATPLRTSRRGAFCWKTPPIGANQLQHSENSDSDPASKNLIDKRIRSSLHSASLQQHNLILQLKEIASTASSGVSSIRQTHTDISRTAPRTDGGLDLPTTTPRHASAQKARTDVQLVL